jgi:biotin-dependent carboxylase-like uncharacterized protein
MPINVLSAGLATTIQDLGRPGYYHLGIPISGAMDRYALRCANLLVGNDEAAAGLEAVFIGPELEFEEDTVVAVTGADMKPLVDEEEREPWTSIEVKKGQKLSFDFLKGGARIYIAVAGGLQTPVMLDSRSTYVIGSLGGVEGRAVQVGDSIPTGRGKARIGRSIPPDLRRLPNNPVELRVLTGLYWHRLMEDSQRSFFEDTWKVAPECDRMGYRFRGGTPMKFVEREQPFGAGSDPSNITDACYPYGSIQVSGGSEPIILHRDAVSAGGYMMLGTVISADMDLVGQMQPHTPTRFVEVDMDTALRARQERRTLVDQVRETLARQ